METQHKFCNEWELCNPINNDIDDNDNIETMIEFLKRIKEQKPKINQYSESSEFNS